MDSSRRFARQWSPLFAIVFACAATACASTKGGVELKQPLATGFDAADFDRVGVNVDTAPQVEMMDYERERITQKIEQELRKRGPIWSGCSRCPRPGPRSCGPSRRFAVPARHEAARRGSTRRPLHSC